MPGPTLPPERRTAAQFTFSTYGSQTVYGRVINQNGGYTDYTTTVCVVQPVLQNVQVAGCDEEDIATLTGTIADPQASPLSLTVTWGNGDQGTYQLAANATSFTLTHYYKNSGNFTVTIKCAGDTTTLATATAAVAVATPDAQVFAYEPSENSGTTLHLEAIVWNLPENQNLTYDWTLQDQSGATVQTGQDATFDFTIPDPSQNYFVDLQVNNGTQSQDQRLSVFSPGTGQYSFPGLPQFPP